MAADEAQGSSQGPPPAHDPRSYTAYSESHEQDDHKAQAGGRKNGGDQEGKKKGGPRRLITIAIVVLIAAVLIVLGVLYWLNARHFQSTDDAFIDTHIVRLSPRISGRVLRVLVDDNQRVAAGQAVLELDPRDFQTRVEQAQATAAQAEAQIAQAQAQLVQIGAQVQVNAANVRQAEATAAGNAAEARYAASDLARYERLRALNPRAVAQQQFDQASAQAQSTAAQREAAVRQVQAAQNQVAATESQRASALAQIAAGEAQKRNAQAQIQAAQLDLSYTTVHTPIAGTVAQRTVAEGNYLNAGAQVMAIVPLRIWVTANFKETQLAYMRPGQQADIRVDACPQDKIHGHVDSIQRGSGQVFGLLPPENATGNFVKVVQRVPVKILIDNPPKDCPLGPGLSVEPKVRVR